MLARLLFKMTAGHEGFDGIVLPEFVRGHDVAGIMADETIACNGERAGLHTASIWHGGPVSRPSRAQR